MENPHNIKKTCLNDQHRLLGAKMVEFGGFDMPIEYSDIVSEHNAVRTSAGVFDVSHMGEVRVSGPQAIEMVNHIFTNDVTPIANGQIVYGMMLHPDGGTIDDLLVYRLADHDFLLVINAANIDKDVAHILSQAKPYNVSVEHLSDSCGELALQGPDSPRIMKDVLSLDVDDLTFYTFKIVHLDGQQVIVSRTGYTGEDGFEIYASHELTVKLWQQLMAAGVTPCGLGCRDTLRFEAGLPLYGDELTDTISPVEAGLSMFLKPDKEGGFIGRDAVATQKANGPKRRVVGLELQGPGIARHGYQVLDDQGMTIGEITTGYHSITLDKSIAMALIDSRYAAQGTQLLIQIRRRTVPAIVVKKRFYTPNYKK